MFSLLAPLLCMCQPERDYDGHRGALGLPQLFTLDTVPSKCQKNVQQHPYNPQEPIPTAASKGAQPDQPGKPTDHQGCP